MRRLTAITIATGSLSMAGGAFAQSPSPTSADPIVRTILLTAPIEGSKLVDHVEMRAITIAAHQRTGPHVHPCPVVGTVTSGSIVFQVEGQAERTLKAGDAFYEPANTPILHFDTAAEPATFAASFLLGKDQANTVVMLDGSSLATAPVAPRPESNVSRTDASAPARTTIKDDAASAVVRVRFRPGEAEEPHTHPFDATVIITAAGTGSVEFSIGGKVTRSIKVGDVFLVPRNVTHHITNLGSEPIEFVTVAIK
jgi:quercetin dioxygenase-like cupin family protein